MFQLNKNLQDDGLFVTDLKICRVLLMNNKNFPWLILVPRIDGAVELTDLDEATQIEILQEINIVAKFLQKNFQPYKINIATLGNVVRQLHIHVIARFENDICFPKPVWGQAAEVYSTQEANNLIAKIQANLLDKEMLLKQLLYRSIHRGCKETDFLIGEFAKENLANFDLEQLNLFAQFIVEDDLLIYDWLLEKADAPKKYEELLLVMRGFHKM